jgi:hypothetical protein
VSRVATCYAAKYEMGINKDTVIRVSYVQLQPLPSVQFPAVQCNYFMASCADGHTVEYHSCHICLLLFVIVNIVRNNINPTIIGIYYYYDCYIFYKILLNADSVYIKFVGYDLEVSHRRRV